MIKKEMNKVKLTPEQIKKNIRKVISNIREVEEIVKLFPNIKEREIKTFGNASHIVLPKEYTNKKAIVIIKK